MALFAAVVGVLLSPRAAATNGAPSNSPPAAATNKAAPVRITHFPVRRYILTGNTLLPYQVVDEILARHTGTNVTFEDVAAAVKELQMEYHNRGFDTVKPVIPRQDLSNGLFRIQILEGRLTKIVVMGNRYFSSNNVMRALPGLSTNMFLNSKIIQPQLDMANANQDRQIYPEIHPGPDSNTSMLILRVKDHLPVHAKFEANNQSTSGTPDLRMATSIADENLWQLEHQMGVQYTFSETDDKLGNWPFYDVPQVANYSTFYRMPLGGPDSLAEDVARNPASFGYNEATRKFVLPASTGAPELNVFASGSTIDSGITESTPKYVVPPSTNGSITSQSNSQTLTYNDALGLRISQPWPALAGFRPTFQVGVDYKYFKQVSYETNVFVFTEHLTSASGFPYTTNFTTLSPTPTTTKRISYFPFTVRWDAARDDSSGSTTLGLNYSPNFWISGTDRNLQSIAATTERITGFWHIVNANLGREQNLPASNWKLALRADGQWASEPLISNEQFGAGGIAGVRGYREGEVFGDSGWRVTSELKSAPYRVGYAGKGTDTPLIVRASFFMDGADTYLSAPASGPSSRPLWGAGVAGSASLGSHFNSMFCLAWPFLDTPTTEAYHMRIAFYLNAQF
jgi:hemolysin activation/secretion protein